ncbi:probable beta-1,3-galactosyltransferase 8 [Chenopodium quinoa]|uniref:probable beta-1,3-galactosyltransferase 8 n=1 Tax=Chenopodium quinoa TaxID=63459 RepID=UPI000B76F6CF|nr:probable beta-1,3-galactosyltransferase 8 [Chenopodium quinoa]
MQKSRAIPVIIRRMVFDIQATAAISGTAKTTTSNKGVRYHELEHWKFEDDGKKYFRHATGPQKHACIYVATNVTVIVAVGTDIYCYY